MADHEKEKGRIAPFSFGMQAVWKSRNTRFDNDIALPWHAPGGDDAFSFFETSQKKARS